MVHCVPIQTPYSDFYDAMTLLGFHDDTTAKIAAVDRDWSRRFRRKEDMNAYPSRSVGALPRVAIPAFAGRLSDRSI
ncbi:hypothetical protein EDC04DRAFT_2695618 [Pisolithus marmoratus]|nr:hypothetical protein EDC04DRAFT_2695618 [Pisolithus marmoratus]